MMMTATAFGLDCCDLVGAHGPRRLTLARRVAMYVARKSTVFSLATIGRAFGTDHSNVKSACAHIEKTIANDPKLAALIRSLIDGAVYRKLAADRAGIDTLALARQIAANPRRMAVAARALEITALATAVVDLWEVATAAETLVGELGRCDIETHEPKRATLVATLIQNITSEMNHIAGPAETPLEPAEAERS